ncbi:MAG: hypothetical protein ACR2H2_06230 [Solirubrobacteraceae bacterium]
MGGLALCGAFSARPDDVRAPRGLPARFGDRRAVSALAGSRSGHRWCGGRRGARGGRVIARAHHDGGGCGDDGQEDQARADALRETSGLRAADVRSPAALCPARRGEMGRELLDPAVGVNGELAPSVRIGGVQAHGAAKIGCGRCDALDDDRPSVVDVAGRELFGFAVDRQAPGTVVVDDGAGLRPLRDIAVAEWWWGHGALSVSVAWTIGHGWR